MRELKEKINELNIKSQKYAKLKLDYERLKKKKKDLENMYYDLIERYEELTKKENPREYKRRDLKEEDIEILLLDEEKENDKTL